MGLAVAGGRLGENGGVGVVASGLAGEVLGSTGRRGDSRPSQPVGEGIAVRPLTPRALPIKSISLN